MSRRIPFCPDCHGPLDPDGPADFWCPGCQLPVRFTAAILLTTAGGADD